ncbi:MAG: ABC transporter permease [Candidatus Heimdallarchaeota archaeon]|nr:MAG: ABC transporter permease [Candidatus Heimdallarchaeota archaeon]
MKVKNIHVLVKKELKKLTRVPAHLFQAILFPIVLTGAFGLAFGSFGRTGNEITFTIGIVDNDRTEWAEYFIGNISENALFVESLYEDQEIALQDLKQGKIDALIIIPNNFQASIESFWEQPNNVSTWKIAEVKLFVDQGSYTGINAIPPSIQQALQKTLHGEQVTTAPQPVHIGTPSQVSVERYTQFDYMAPGMFAFAAIFLTLIVAEGFTEERMKGILRRIQLTPTSPGDIVLSNIIANMLIAVVQVILIVIISCVMGFNPQGGLIGIIVAFTFVSLLAFCNVGFGLIAASIAKTPGAATTISFAFILPQMFLGTFMPVPKEFGQLVPSYYVTDGLTSILLRGASVTSYTILMDLGIIIGFCVVITVSGVIIFAKFGRDKLR